MTVDSPQQFSLSFPDIDSLTESIEGFDLRFLELEREGGGFQMNMLSTPVAMVSQISVSSRVRQEGAPVEGFVTFGLVTDTCGGMRWNNYRLNQSSILVFLIGSMSSVLLFAPRILVHNFSSQLCAHIFQQPPPAASFAHQVGFNAFDFSGILVKTLFEIEKYQRALRTRFT